MKELRRLRQLILRASGPMTAFGRTVVVIGAVAWIVGAKLGWKEMMIVAAACVIALLVSALFTIGRTELHVATALVPPRVVAGERAVGEFKVTNVGKRRMLPVRLELPVGRSFASIDVPSLAHDESFEEVIVIPTTHRAVIQVGPTRSVRGDPLGLMRREVKWADELELFVHPTTSRLQGVASGWLRDLEGRPTNDRSPSDVAFHTLREYVPGDDRRHVHWRTSARLNKLMVRQFIDNRRSHLGIVVDTDPASYADADEFELAVSMAASLGLKAIADGQETSCVAGSAGIASHNGQALLDGFARVELGVPAITLEQTALRAAPIVNSASVIAVVTGSSLTLAHVQLAAQRFGVEPSILCVRAATDEEPDIRRVARLQALTANSLDTFTRVMWTVGNS
jgi:uncharacterized protein (DUF58 family)